MPPKGWRKYADGFRPVNSSGTPLREKENYSIDDLLLPKTTVTKLAKEVLPAESQLPKDGTTALLRSATVFINYLSAAANKNAHDNCRKIIKPQDVYNGLENISLGAFVPLVQEELEKYEHYRQEKKNKNIPDEVSDDEEKDEEVEKRARVDQIVMEKIPGAEWDKGATRDERAELIQSETSINDEEMAENDPSDTEVVENTGDIENAEDHVEDLGNAVPAESDNEDDDEETAKFRQK